MGSLSTNPAVISQSVATPNRVEPSRRGFWALIATQFQGAFSDNILRNLLLSMIVGMQMKASDRETFISVVTFLFSVPFLILSMPGGWLADRFSKRQITIWTKGMEFGSMLLATAGLMSHQLWLSLVALTLVASQAALFGPSKYGLLPELLPEKSLSWGNGVIELGTFLAIIVGTVAGAGMGERFQGHEQNAGYVLLGLSVLGFATSLGIEKVPRRRSRETVPGKYRRRFVEADRDHAPQPSAASGCPGQHLFLVPWFSAVFDHRGLRSRRTARRSDEDRLPECDAGSRDRPGKYGRRMGERQQDRIWVDSARLDRHDLHRICSGHHAPMEWWDRPYSSACSVSGPGSLPYRSTR